MGGNHVGCPRAVHPHHRIKCGAGFNLPPSRGKRVWQRMPQAGGIVRTRTALDGERGAAQLAERGRGRARREVMRLGR